MTALTHDTSPTVADRASGRRLGSGLAFAVVSAASFGLSGALARPLLDIGWSAGALVLVRVGLAALVVLPLAALSLRGRWALLRSNLGVVVLYGLLAVTGAQFCYFSAVSHMQVGPALMIEYTGPAAVVLWLWLRHGERPGPVTLIGAGIAAVGLVLVLDLASGADLDPTGVLWALGAMVGLASFFLISADADNGLPPLALAAGGLLVGAVFLAVLAAVGALPMHGSTAPATYAGRTVAWWLPLLALGLVTAALSFTTGIAASRRLGSRLASFVGLAEVLAGVGAAWWLLAELPGPLQLLGGALILLGVVGVQLGEKDVVGP